jgi:hypothetical protein
MPMTTPFHEPQWLPTMDSNHDKQIQSLLCYRYTSRQSHAQSTGFTLRVNHA